MSYRHLDTSRAAYREVIPKLNEKQAEVLAVIERLGPVTNSEIADALGWKINLVTPRVHELRYGLDKVRDAGKRPCRVTGRLAYQWVVGSGEKPSATVAKPKMVPVSVMVDGQRRVRMVPESEAENYQRMD